MSLLLMLGDGVCMIVRRNMFPTFTKVYFMCASELLVAFWCSGNFCKWIRRMFLLTTLVKGSVRKLQISVKGYGKGRRLKKGKRSTEKLKKRKGRKIVDTDEK